jgi:hypothetical protein
MTALIPTLIAGTVLVSYQQPARQEAAMDQAAAATYEHLATAIIEVRETEDSLVRSILLGYHAAAQSHLRAAAAEGDERRDDRAHLEAAAAQITNIANEGDKRIQAVRQRLSKAGHTHHTDADTKEDYLFVNSQEKKDLLALARRVAQAGPKAQPDDVKGLLRDLDALFAKAIAPE